MALNKKEQNLPTKWTFSLIFLRRCFIFLPRHEIKPNFCSNSKHVSLLTENTLAIIAFN